MTPASDRATLATLASGPQDVHVRPPSSDTSARPTTNTGAITQHSTIAMTKDRIEIHSKGDSEGPERPMRVSVRGVSTLTIRRWVHIAALVCVLGSLPLALLTYPWLPATVGEFVELRHDPLPSATLSYRDYRAQRLQHLTLA